MKRKKQFSLLLAALMAIGVISAAAMVESKAQTAHEHSSSDFTAWSDTGSLPTEKGSYYLTKDVTLSNTASMSKDITLCLNGHIVKVSNKNYYAIEVKNGGSLQICDCSDKQYHINGIGTDAIVSEGAEGSSPLPAVGGVITGGRGIEVETDGTLTLSGGNIAGNQYIGAGGGVYASGPIVMTGGSISYNSAGSEGGGVYTSSTFEMTGGSVSHNSAEKYGGGIYAKGTFTITNGTISYNRSNQYDGGGVYAKSAFNMTGGSISYNQTVQKGGGVFTSGSFKMTGGSVSYNQTTKTDDNFWGGGGVYASGEFTMTGGTISHNRSAKDGGGLYSTGHISIASGTISDNTAAEDGGGVYGYDEPIQISGGTISGNRAKTGGGVYNALDVTQITGGTIQGNTAETYGGVYNSYSKPITLSGSVQIYGNTATKTPASADLYQGNNQYVIAKIGADGLSDSAKIGIGTSALPGEGHSTKNLITAEDNASIDLSLYIGNFVSHHTEAGLTLTVKTAVSQNDVDAIVLFRDNHTHNYGGNGPEGEGKCTQCNNIRHDGVEFEPWYSGSTLPSGSRNYYLTKDVKLENRISLANGTVQRICLNGHMIRQETAGERIFHMWEGASLSIYDCAYGWSDKNPVPTRYFTKNEDQSWSLSETKTDYAVTGGLITGGESSAIYMAGSGTLALHGGTIAGNRSSVVTNGGGIRASGSFTMTGGAVCYNYTTGTGGGIYTYDGAVITGGTISHNYANATTHSGGGIYTGDAANLSNVTISHNRTAGDGGGVCLWNGGTLTNVTLEHNTAGNKGGGIFAIGNTCTITDCTLNGNTAVDKGGGAYVSCNMSAAITGTSITNNTSIGTNVPHNESIGGGLHIGGSVSLSNCTITGNKAQGPAAGGGIAYGSASTELTLSGKMTITDNTARIDTGSYPEGQTNNLTVPYYTKEADSNGYRPVIIGEAGLDPDSKIGLYSRAFEVDNPALQQNVANATDAAAAEGLLGIFTSDDLSRFLAVADGDLLALKLASITYTVTLPTAPTGYTLAPQEDAVSPVSLSGSYKFKVTVGEDYDGANMVVKANGVPLTADARGVYTIKNIQADQTVTVEGVVFASRASITAAANGDVSVAYQLEGQGILIVARYDGGRMTATAVRTVTSTGSLQLDLSSGSGAEYRAFLLDSSRIPLCKPAVYPAP